MIFGWCLTSLFLWRLLGPDASKADRGEPLEITETGLLQPGGRPCRLTVSVNIKVLKGEPVKRREKRKW